MGAIASMPEAAAETNHRHYEQLRLAEQRPTSVPCPPMD